MPVVAQQNVTAYPINAVSVDALKSDSADLPSWMTVQVKGASGNVKFTPAGGGTALTLALALGETINCRVRRVWSTGTTATGLIGYY